MSDKKVLNPKTGRYVKVGGPTYKKLKLGEKKSSPKTVLNPLTGKRVKAGGPAHKQVLAIKEAKRLAELLELNATVGSVYLQVSLSNKNFFDLAIPSNVATAILRQTNYNPPTVAKAVSLMKKYIKENPLSRYQ